ncbi:AbaSI family restriction endonuclease [Microbacterium sp.]|uniref:AbaSI family restriction endonuclease n=1 Tax=Microbacterium sp. TaxID=51671 RepID=UPI0039E38321
MIDRLEYLARTLSRTKRKDYENYVINAVWNRLDTETRSKLKPVSQQTIRTRDGTLRYIDLLFPQLNLAIECDDRGAVQCTPRHELQTGAYAFVLHAGDSPEHPRQ